MKVTIKRIDKKIPLPKYEKRASGFDFVLRKGETFRPGEIKAVPANVVIQVPDGYVLLVVPRSSTATRVGLAMPHSMGVVDPFYCGDTSEIVLLFQNITDKTVRIKKGDVLAQGLLLKCEQLEFEEVDKMPTAGRGAWKLKKLRKQK